MSGLVKIEIDSVEVQRICRERISELVKEVNSEYVFWDSEELMKRTCMSWNFIQAHFFFDPRFIKRKVGTKWLFPVQDAREFLREWLLEQPTS